MRVPLRSPWLVWVLVLAVAWLAGCGEDSSSGSGSGGDGSVVVNGATLTQAQLDEIYRVFGEVPAPGRYWYDAVSGLAGVEGAGPSAFLPANLPFAPVATGASGGGSGFVVNGREATPAEISFLEQIFQTSAIPGSYTLLPDGTLYPEGNPFLSVSIPGAMQASGMTDNFWSSRYGIGNSSGGCSYISIPNASGGLPTSVTSGCG